MEKTYFKEADMEIMTVIALIVSGVGTVITATALVIAIISLKSTTKQIGRVTQTLESITTRIEKIFQSLEGITVRIERIDQSLESITQRNERIISTLLVVEEKLNISAYRDDLAGMAWKTRLRACQRQAALHKPAYVEPQPDTPIRYVLTPAGKEFLSADLKEDIIQVLSEDASTENNMLSLILGLPRLLREAKEKGVELDVLLGIIASYADELREQNATDKSTKVKITP